MMNDRTKIEILREEITIPQIVQQKADSAYAMLREQNHKAGKTRMKKTLPLVAVAVMLAAGAFAAAGTKWNAGISGKWQVEEPQKESLQEEGAVSFAMQSQTMNGVTITADQTEEEEQYYTEVLDFILNTRSMKFHTMDCPRAADISAQNRDYFRGTRQELLDMGNTPAQECN